jgi:hypothetical protein
MTMELAGLVTRMGREGTVFTIYVGDIEPMIPGFRYEYIALNFIVQI